MKKRTKFLLIIIILAAIVALINVLSGGDKSTTPSDNQTPAVISGEGKKADIWVADEFNPPVNLGAPINTLKWEDGPSISPDGNTLYFTIGRDRYVDSYFSQKVNGKWSNPQPHSFNLEDFPDGAVHTQDNKILYLASIRPGGIGVLGDIYLFENNQLTNLGAPVNTESMEI